MNSNKKLCIAMYGRPNSGKTRSLSKVLFDGRFEKDKKDIIQEGIYYYNGKKILVIQRSMEESFRDIGKILKTCENLKLKFDVILIAVKMLMTNKRSKTMDYLVKNFDVKLFVLKDKKNNYKLPYGIKESDYQIEQYVDYVRDEEFRTKVNNTADAARKLL